MNKRELSKIPIRMATGADITHSRLTKGSVMLLHCMLQNELLMLTLYQSADLQKGMRTPYATMYLQHDDYITRQWDHSSGNIKWLTGRLLSIYRAGHLQLLDTASLIALRQFLSSSEATLESLHDLQDNIVATRLARRHRIIKDRIDAAMALIPSWPDDLTDFINDSVLTNRYIYYDYARSKRRSGFCTNCRNDIVVDSPRHNQEGTCPTCGATALYKSRGRFRYGIWDQGEACIPQKIQDGFVLRYIDMSRKESPDGQRSLSINETHRIMFKHKKVSIYTYDTFLSTGQKRWCEQKDSVHLYDGCRYPLDASLTKDTVWEYSGVEQYGVQECRHSSHQYLLKYLDHPYLEQLTKVGLTNLVDSVLYHKKAFASGYTRLHLTLGVSRMCQQLLIHHNASWDQYEIAKALSDRSITCTWEMVMQLSADWQAIATTMIRHAMPYATPYRIEQYAANLTIHAKRMWLDYLIMAQEVGYDMRDRQKLFPLHLKKEHDAVTIVHRELQAKKNASVYEKKKQQFTGYEWRPDGSPYLITVPEHAVDIVNEGKVLHHCVHRYVKDVIQDKCVILFLREATKPQVPYVTIEMRKQKVVQARGYDNASVNTDVESFLDAYVHRLASKQALAA